MGRVSLETLLDRSIKNMGNVHQVVKETTIEVIKRAYAEGINVQISMGLRTYAQQDALYAQGRTKPGNVVTNARGGYSNHNFGLAVDYFLTTNDGKSAVWVVNKEWRRVAEIAKSLGFTWGGDWKSFVDNPHLEMTGGLTTAQLRAGQRPNLVSKVGNATPKPSQSETAKPSNEAQTTTSIVTYLELTGQNSSFNARKELANRYGISNYSGTASQNTDLLNKVRGGVAPIKSKPVAKGNQTTGSIVEYLNSIGVDSSYNNRARLAVQYGVPNYKGTASQNTQLLNKMRGGSTQTAQTKSVDQMAREIISNPKVPTGHANRQKWLGVDKATYEKVRTRVNQLSK